jgi:hypothetical protein
MREETSVQKGAGVAGVGCSCEDPNNSMNVAFYTSNVARSWYFSIGGKIASSDAEALPEGNASSMPENLQAEQPSILV